MVTADVGPYLKQLFPLFGRAFGTVLTANLRLEICDLKMGSQISGGSLMNKAQTAISIWVRQQ